MPSRTPDSRSLTKVRAELTLTWYAEGYTRSGTQVLGFSEEAIERHPGFVVHEFKFVFDGAQFEFKITGEKADGLDLSGEFVAMIDPNDLSRCWMNGSELVVHPLEPWQD